MPKEVKTHIDATLGQQLIHRVKSFVKPNIHIHHLSYENIGNERIGDLLIVCEACHHDLHVFIDRMRRKGFKRPEVMKRLAPYCVRRMLAIHKRWEPFKKPH